MPKAPEPYPDNAAYLEAELKWIEARCHRLHASRMASNTVRDFPVSAPEQSEANRLRLFAWQKRKIDAQRTERYMRMEVDERLEQTRRVRRPPALDDLCSTNALSPEERTVVLLAAATSLNRAFEPLFAELSNFECEGVLCPGAVFDFLALSTAERIRARERFSPDAPLLSQGLIQISPKDAYTTVDLVNRPIQIRAKALNALLGHNPTPPA